MKVAAVLGVGPGLGTAIAWRFAGEGFAVALMARREESVAAAREEVEGGKAMPVSTDATDPDSVAAAFDRVRAELGDPEVFIYNAGAFQMGGVLEVSSAQFDECFRANCAGGRCALTADPVCKYLSW
jgi:NAD(P)-dependent dehydrogenase (short-subunit alcohol dehydrogenase family)